MTEGRAPRVVRESVADGAADLLRALGLDGPRPVVVLFGGADAFPDAVRSRLRRFLARGVARPAAQAGAVVVDGATRSGVMEMMGEAVAELGHQSPLVGVAPAALVQTDGASGPGRVPLDPNHSHVVLSLGEQWGDERDTLLAVAATLARGRGIVTVVAGGGAFTRQEVLEAVRRRWPIILLEGTGGTADEIAALVRARPDAITDPALGTIVRDGALSVVPLAGSPEPLAERIRREAESETTLRSAWQRFATLDLNATTQQRTFRLVQAGILALGLAGAFLAVLKETLARPSASGPASMVAPGAPLERVLFAFVLVIPIVVSGAIAARNLFKSGNKWLLMRTAAEAIKREIFRYRTRAGDYRHADRDGVLAQQIENITRRLARTEVNAAALAEYRGALPPTMGVANPDDGLSPLSPDRYVEIRLADQLGYYRRRALRVHRAFVASQIIILALGGLGTLLAALNQAAWVAVTTAAVTAITSHLGYRQFEMTLTTYNQTATDLENVIGWWQALAPEAQADSANVDKLVEYGEKVMESEMAGWVQKMQDALVELRKDDEATKTSARKPSGQPPPSSPAKT